MSKKKASYLLMGKRPPVVIKVTVTNGQARVNLPKHIAIQYNLLIEDGKPGKVKYLLVRPHRGGIRLSPVEMTEVEEE